MILLLFILLLYSAYNYFDARWDAEQLTPGQSNHIFKTMHLITLCLIAYSFGIVGYFLFDNLLWWLKMGLIVIIFPFLRIAQFDWFLNHYRDKVPEYKTNPVWIKYLSLIAVVCLLTLFFYL